MQLVICLDLASAERMVGRLIDSENWRLAEEMQVATIQAMHDDIDAIEIRIKTHG